MSNWQNTTIFFGTFKEGNTVRMIFRGTSFLPKVKQFVGSCGCTDFKFDEKTKELSVKLSLNKIPPQVVNNYMDINKTITAYYEDGTTEVLLIKGIITK
jgi:hypothetical protein